MDGNEIARRLIAEEREKLTGFLDLGNLGLTEVPSEVFDLTHLHSLSLGWWFDDETNERHESNNHVSLNELTELPDGLGDLGNLRVLSLVDNPLYDLDLLRALPLLQSLNCAGTGVRDLRPLRRLRLTLLNCSNTQVSDLRPARGTDLQSLDCSSTKVEDLGALDGLATLRSLHCSETWVSDLAPLRTLTALKLLDCSGTKVSDLNPLRTLPSLQWLECARTEVSDLSPLSTLTALQSLNCSRTEVSDLGPLHALTALQSLECWHTKVSDLSPVRTLTALQSLDCSRTNVTDLSPVDSLATLRSLRCGRTRIGDLSPLRSLTALQWLDCSDTQVSDLGPLAALPLLSELDASGCRLSDLPLSLVGSTALTKMVLYDARVPGIPDELLSPDVFSSCLDALRSHVTDLEAGAEEVLEAKLVVLGNGRVGKTQLCRRLRGLPYDEAVPSTHGITVTAERWAGSTTDEALNIWDFGGQDIYHGAHALFMQTSAVFLIVWHPDFETASEQNVDGVVFRNYPLSYWLEYVRTLARRDCPVIVVQTRCDRPEQEVRRLPAEDALLAFPSLKPCWYSAKTNRGRGALEDALRDAIQFLRERDGIATVGAGRMRVLRRLEAWRNEDQTRPTIDRQHRTLSQTEFVTLCEQAGGVSSPHSLLAYLHNLGVVFHQRELFQDRIILDQSWALEAVYGVFDRTRAYPLILSQGGRFTESLLAMTAWREYAAGERRLFLSLMESCGISFEHRRADSKLELEAEYLAPDLLPGKDAVAAQLAGRWRDDEETWRLEYEYPFLHSGLMRALLCDVGRRSGEAGVYWRYGVWVFDGSSGCRALLEQQMQNDRQGRIAIRVQGRRHEGLITWLRERLDARNRLFGYADLPPTVDDFSALRQPDERIDPPDRLPGHATGVAKAPVVEPSFDKPPASFFPPREPQVFVSYAWGDDTPEGRIRAKVVDDLCTALATAGVTVRRDRDEMSPGNLISEFMDRLADGDFVVAVITNKYLESEYCMYELFRIYRNCADKPERFLQKVIPLILPDAALSRLEDRLGRAVYWTDMETQLTPLVKDNLPSVGTEFFRKFDLIRNFAHTTSNMLEYLVDKLQPRDFDRQAAEGFQEVLSQIRRTD